MFKTKFNKTIKFIDDHSTAILFTALAGVTAAAIYDLSTREIIDKDKLFIPADIWTTMVETGASVVSDSPVGTFRLTLTPNE